MKVGGHIVQRHDQLEEAMLILRQKMLAKPAKSDELMAALAEIVTPARATEGVISLDIARVAKKGGHHGVPGRVRGRGSRRHP